MKRFWTPTPPSTEDIPAPQHSSAHQERVLDALWPESATRRRFLIGVGGSLPLVGGVARAATTFTMTEDPHGATVAIADFPVWRIDTRWFDGRPRVKVRQSANALRIDLQQARFPGTTIRADFTLSAARHGTRWKAVFDFGALGFAAAVDFSQWLLGIAAAEGQLRLDGARLACGSTVALGALTGRVQFRPDWSFQLDHLTSGNLVLAGRTHILDALRLELDVSAGHDAAHSPGTRAWMHLSRGDALSFDLHGGTLELGSGPALAFVHARHAHASILVQPSGGDRAQAHLCWQGEAPVRLPVDGACGRFELTGNRVHVSARALWKRSYWHVEPALAARFSTTGLGPAVATAPADPLSSAARASLPVADHFVINLPGVDAAMFSLRPSHSHPLAADGGAADVRHVAGNDIPLRYYDLHLRRASDALFCTVRFRGLKLQRHHGAWRLVQIDRKQPALVEFDLGAQHVLEQALLLEEWPDYNPADYKWPKPSEAPDPDLALKASRVDPARMRFEAARPSHLTFALKSKDRLATLPLNVDALFSWSDDGRARSQFASSWFEPVLAPRAQPAGTLPMRHPATAADDDLVITRPSSLADDSADAADFATAIEAPARLVISPVPAHLADQGYAMVPWQSPPAGPLANKALRAELWHARLHAAKVRAIYSADATDTPLAPGAAPRAPGAIQVAVFNPPAPFPNGRDRFRAATDSRDRHELVALTALSFPAKCEAGLASTCTARDGTVRYVPVPIHADLLLLSSQGASFRYRGRWKPPSSTVNGSGALTVQRYIHFSQLGRDIFCKVEYQGFLFPLGHPAILIKQTERKFFLRTIKDDKGATIRQQFVAGLMQRFFIHVPAFNRQFPAIDQGMDGRLWGHANTMMDDVITPSLVDPAICAVATFGRTVFWPRLPGREGADPTDVLFEFYEAGAEARYLAPLVWIDNNVANAPANLDTVIRAWRAEVSTRLAWTQEAWPGGAKPPTPSLPGTDLRHFATVRSARLPYVPGVNGENTDIETTTILLGVQLRGDSGYSDGAPCDGALAFTPRMLAQNQPPFYPSRRRARIVSSLLATLTGKRTEAYLLQFDPVYIANGMAPANGSTAFGVFAGSGAAMDFGNDTAKSGGFANPSALMVNYTAKRGPVGGSANIVVALSASASACAVVPANPSAAGAALALALAPSPPPTTTDDDFKPKEYFAAVLGDAKLLGVVRLVDILETLLAATGSSFPTIKRESLFELPLQALREMMPLLLGQLAQFDGMFANPSTYTPSIPEAVAARLQPSWNRLRAAVAACNRLITQPAPDPLAVIGAGSAVAAAAQALMADTRALIADPVLLLPEAARALLADAEQLINLLRALLPPRQLLAVCKPLADAVVAHQVARLIDALRAAIVTAPAYAAAYRTLSQLNVLIAEFQAAASDARVLVEALRANLLQRMRDALTDAVLQLAMARQALKLLPDTLLGQLAPLVAAQVAGQKKVYGDLLLAGAGAVSAPVGALHEMLDGCTAQLTGTIWPSPAAVTPEQARIAEGLVHLRRAVSAIGDALNAYVDRMQRIADDAPHLEAIFPPPPARPALTGRAGPANALADLIPLLGDVVEQAFDAASLGMLIVTRLAEILEGLAALYPPKPKPNADPGRDPLASARAVVTTAAIHLGYLVSKADLSSLSRQLTALANPNNALPAMRVFWPLLDTAAQVVSDVQAMLVGPGGLLTPAAAAQWPAPGADVLQVLQQTYARTFARLATLDNVRSTLVRSVRALSPEAIDARVRAEVNARIDALKKVLVDTVDAQLAQVDRAALSLFCDTAGNDLRNALNKVHASGSPYLSQQAKDALQTAIHALDKCATDAPGALAEMFNSLSALMTLLGRTLASGDVSQLVSVEKVLDTIVAQFGIPTRVRINYDWDTQVDSFPKGDDAIFEPLETRKLAIASVIEAGLRDGAPSASMKATLSPFAVHLFGKTGAGNFLSVYFDGLVLTATPAKGIECKTKVTRVEPGDALGFVKKLSELFAPSAGFYMLPTVGGIEVGYKFGSEYELLAGLVLQNINFTIAATLPFDNSPMRMRLQLSDKEKPFLCSVGIYGGGGFLAIVTRADTLELLEASFEYGAMVAFAYGPAKGSGRVTAGIYIRMGGRDPVIEGFFCAQGEVSIASLITMSATLRVTLTYHVSTGQAAGAAVYTFKFSIGFFNFRYSARVDYAKQGDQGAATPRDQRSASSGYTASGAAVSPVRPLRLRGRGKFDKAKPVDTAIHAGLLAPAVWRRYWRAFARPNPDRPPRIASVSQAPAITFDRKTDPKVARAVAAVGRKMAIVPGALAAMQVVEWYCVPWGSVAGATKTAARQLNLSVRTMPKFTAGNDSAAEIALADWPAFMAAIEQVTLNVNGHLVVVDLGAFYLARLKELGLSLSAMSRLWKEVFPRALARPATPVAQAALPARGPRDDRYVLHNTAELAVATASTAGRLFAEALGDLKAERIKALAANGLVKQAEASKSTAVLLGDIAGLYTPVSTRERKLHRSAPKEMRTSADVVRNWYANTQFAGSEAPGFLDDGKGDVGKVAATPYSAKALAMVDRFFRPAPRPASTGAAAKRPFNELLLRHRVAHTSDLPGKTVLPIETVHDRLAGLSTHPWLLKALGLVVDLRVDMPVAAPTTATAPPPPQRSITLTQWNLGGAPAIVPALLMRTIMTQYDVPMVQQDDLKYRGSETGCMNLAAAAGNAYQLHQIDTDRTPERLLQLALSYRSQVMAGQHASEIATGLQGQDSVGLSLVARDPAIVPPVVAAAINGHASGAFNDVYVHHLAIGYRPDVQRLVSGGDPAGARVGPWTSLMARKLGRVRVRGHDVTHLLGGIEVDEGILMERTRTVVAEGAGKTHREAELVEGELFRWGTWVLGAAHPDSDGAPLERAPAEDQPASTSDTDAKIAVDYDAAPGATAQRYGSGYRVGMRLVMVDGNSVPLEHAARAHYRDAADTLSLGDETSAHDYGFAPFLRFESLAPPTPLLVAPLQRERFPTESARKLVVASGAAAASRTTTQRVLVAPRCASIDLAIRHGMFDAPGHQQAPPASAFRGVTLNARGDFPAYKRGAGDHASTDLYYKVQPGAVAPQIPYYPDPWAQRMIIGFYRAADDCLLAVDYFDYYDDATYRWPNCRVLHLDLVAAERVEHAALGFDWALADNRMTVRIAPGVRLTMRTWHELDVEKLNQSAVIDQMVVACRLDQGGEQLRANLDVAPNASDTEVREKLIAVLSQWHTKRNFAQQTARPSQRMSAITNLTSFWMLNPAVQLELLHAVAQPLRAPELSDVGAREMPPRLMQLPAHASAIEKPFKIVRKAAETSAAFTGHVRLHRPSTRSIEAQASWRDNAMRAVRNPHNGRFSCKAEMHQGLLFNLAELAEVAVDDQGAAPATPMAPELDAKQDLQGLEAVVPVNPRRPASTKPISGIYDFGDTRARVLEVQLLARARHAPDFGGAGKEAHLLRAPPQRVIAEGTERPSAPTVEYVMPLYNWANGEAWYGRIRRTREAGWFRIWLGKEWYSVGNGELLGIVCWPDTLLAPAERRFLLSRTRPTPHQFATPPADIEPFVTRWGLDPLVEQKEDMGNMPASALKNRLRNIGQLRASAANDDATIEADAYHLRDMPSFEPQVCIEPTQPDATLALALYRPLCDTASGRWYADIQIDPAYAYCPFVRLGLARYQPHALEPLRMSPIVATSFIQLLPERTTTIVPGKGKDSSHTFDVILSGSTLGAARTADSSHSTFSVRIENRQSSDGGWFALPASAGAGAEPWTGTAMEHNAADGIWTANLRVERIPGRSYSLVIEEYENLRDGQQGQSRKLVFFDRIALP
jgi:hypothetical protein